MCGFYPKFANETTELMSILSHQLQEYRWDVRKNKTLRQIVRFGSRASGMPAGGEV